MKAKFSLFLLTALLCVSAAFAVNGTGVYSLVAIYDPAYEDSSFVLTQGDLPCTSAQWSMNYGGVMYYNGANYTGAPTAIVGSIVTTSLAVYPYVQTSFARQGRCAAIVSDLPSHLYDIFDSIWTKKHGDENRNMVLGSDIDLGEFSSSTAEGTCDVNHVPLVMPKNIRFNGNGKTIKHLCYAASAMDKPVGFFESFDSVLVHNITLDSVRIVISGTSVSADDYYPVGPLAGKVTMSTVDSIKVSNVHVDAPFAGGLVGYIENATVKNVTTAGNVVVTNNVAITNNFSSYSLLSQGSYGYRVFLGGLAGAVVRNKANASFVDDSISATVFDAATGDSAAIGGIAGLMVSSGDSIYNVDVYGTSISGGSAMGGLVGMVGVLSLNSNYMPGDVLFASSTFAGSISKGESNGQIAVGGLVGYNYSVASMSVRFQNDHANVDIEDSIETTGTYLYAAGGLLGLGSVCNGFNSTDYVSFYKSSSEGKIKIAGNASEVSGLSLSVLMGGIVGSACLALDNGLSNDTSSVELYANVRTAPQTFYAYSADSMNVGGIVGWANVSVAKAFYVENSQYTGRIVVNDSLSQLHVGGIVGSFPQVDGGRSISFKNVTLSADSLVTVNGHAKEKGDFVVNIASRTGGLCGYCNAFQEIENAAVIGNLTVDGYVGDSLLLGGLIGNFLVTDRDSSHTISKTYSIGNIVAKSTSITKVGYLMGSGIIYRYNFESSYHYGSSDTDIGAFGSMNMGSDIAETWMADDSIHYIVRNGATESLSDNGNGTKLASDMKLSAFAGYLNKAFASADDYAWTFVSGKNSNLPFIDAYNAVAPATDEGTYYTVTFEDMNGNVIKQERVKAGENAEAPADSEVTVIEGYTFSGTWSGDYTNVSADIAVVATYTANVYSVMFFAYDGKTQIGETQSVEYGKSAVAPAIPALEGYSVKGWSDSSYVNVTKNLNIVAKYEPLKYRVTFVNYNGSEITSNFVNYGATPDVPMGLTREASAEYTYTFTGWNPAVTVVTGEITYTAVYDSTEIVKSSSSSTEESSSSTEISSSSEEISSSSESISSSSVEESSSSAEPEIVSSSSVEESSSSVEPEVSSSSEESSSSAEVEIKVASHKLEQSGNAVRLSFDADGIDENTTAHVTLMGKNGIILDADLEASAVKGGVWEMTSAPAGKTSVELVLSNGSAETVIADSFEVASEKAVQPKSWQMISIASIDESMLKNGDASFYWWDEENPIGDYWQYREYSESSVQDVAATRGFWYGTTDGTPIVFRETEGSNESEIAWDLDSLYSGWNLVANPYGWYVSLEGGKADNGESVAFWHWNAESSEYEVPTTLAPYEAVWAKVSKATTYRLSAAPVYNVNEESKVVAKKANVGETPAEGWALTVALSDENGKMDSWNVLGAGSAAETLDEPPAGMGDRVSLAIRESANGSKLAKSIRALAKSYEWILDVSASSERNGNIAFDGVETLNAAGLSLYVTADGVTSEVKANESVPVALKKTSQKVTVSVASSAAVAVASNALKDFNTKREAGLLEVGFSAPETLAGSVGSYALVGVNGKVVARGNFTANAGSNVLNVTAPKSGLYFMQVRVGSQKMSGKVLVK